MQTQVIQLSETYGEARAGIALDIGDIPDTATGYKFEAKHVLVPVYGSGVGVIAELEAEDGASATAGIEPDEPGLYDAIPVLNGESIFQTISNALTASFGPAAAAANVGAASSLQVAGALAFSFGTHQVVANVGGTADLQSNGNIDVKAIIDHATNLRRRKHHRAGRRPGRRVAPPTPSASRWSSGSTSPRPRPPSRPARSWTRLRHAHHLPDRAPLQHLARRAVPLDAERVRRFDPDRRLRRAEQVPRRHPGIAVGHQYLVRSTTSADNIGIAGSVTVLKYANEATTTVQDGALINQDLTFRGPGNTHPNNTGDQVVSVEASNYMELINVAGTYDFSFLTGSIDPWNPEVPSISPPGLEGGSGTRGGVGGAIFVMLLDNVTHSVVEDGAAIYSGPDGGFNMKADEAIFNLALAQAGADGGKFAIAGTVVYTEQVSDTLAQLGSGAFVTGRNANLYAAALETQVSVAGAVHRRRHRRRPLGRHQPGRPQHAGHHRRPKTRSRDGVIDPANQYQCGRGHLRPLHRRRTTLVVHRGRRRGEQRPPDTPEPPAGGRRPMISPPARPPAPTSQHRWPMRCPRRGEPERPGDRGGGVDQPGRRQHPGVDRRRRARHRRRRLDHQPRTSSSTSPPPAAWPWSPGRADGNALAGASA